MARDGLVRAYYEEYTKEELREDRRLLLEFITAPEQFTEQVMEGRSFRTRPKTTADAERTVEILNQAIALHEGTEPMSAPSHMADFSRRRIE